MALINVNVHLHFPPCGDGEQGELKLELDNIMADLTELTAAVAQEKTVDDSAIALLQGLKAQLDAAGTDPASLAALSAQLGQEQAALAAAVAANTPAATPPDTGDGA